jgi:hypothetical protein
VAQRRPLKEFKVTIDVRLPEDALDRIERAIQKAVLIELADTDVADGYSVRMRVPGPIEAGLAAAVATEGIWIRPESSEFDE